MGTAPQHQPRARALTAREARLLDEGCLTLPTAPPGADDPIARTIAAFETLQASSLSVPQAATRLGVHTSRLLQRLKGCTLYGLKVGRDWQLPAFQFTEHGEVPNIGKVVVRLNPQLHPMAINTWFNLPDADRRLAGNEASPRQWLLSGGAANPVAKVAAGLGSGM
jgi:hypothetical protein